MTQSTHDIPAGTRLQGLDAFFSARSVAVVGASDVPGKIGGQVLLNLREAFAGTIYPINPNRALVQGLPAIPSILETDLAPDLAIIVAGSDQVPGILEDCATRGVAGAVVFSSGFAEVGEAGRALQDQVAATLDRSGMRLIGPNCFGLVSAPIGLRATFAGVTFDQQEGNVALIGQSGQFGVSLYEQLLTDGLGVSYWVATGNELDVTSGELARRMVEDERIDVVGLVLEGVNRPDEFLAAGRRGRELGKPLVVLKTGNSSAGAKAAGSHTAAVAVESRVFEAACESAGIIVVEDARELIDVLKAFSAGKRAAGRRVAVATGSGGIGVTMADAADELGLAMPAPSRALRGRLTELIPDFGSVENPFDYTGQVVSSQGAVGSILADLTHSDDYDIVCIGGAARRLGQSFRDTIVAAAEATDKPMLVWAHQPDVIKELTSRHVVAIDDPRAVVRAAAALVRFTELRQRAALPAAADEAAWPLSLDVGDSAGPRTIPESEAKTLIAGFGVPTPRERVATDAEHAALLVAELGGRVAMKIDAEWLPHKSEFGAVKLGLSTTDAARAAWAELDAIAKRLAPSAAEPGQILMQEMIPAGIELICGMIRDPAFGPIVTVGLGGVLVEVLAEQQLALAPLRAGQAAELIDRLCGGRLTSNPRGVSEAARAALARVVEAIAHMAVIQPRVQQIDVNPLIVSGDDVMAVDALIILR